MKTLKNNKLILFFLGLVVFNSCVEDDDFNVPNTNIEEPVLDGPVIEISDVLGRLVQQQVSENDNFGANPNNGLNYDSEVTFQYDDETIQYMEGYLISSDEAGNFFEELILQDEPENPTVGIKVPIDVNPLFTKYDIGRKVYIRVTNLHVGISNGVLAIGFKDGDFISKIPFPLEQEIIKRSAEKADLIPLPLTLEEFDDSKTNLFINIPDVQFNRSEAVEQELSFASENFDSFDGERTLESCNSSLSRIFSTSTFADFSGLNLPTGSGSINAILSKNFFGDEFNVVINTPEDISLDSIERCDPFNIDDFDVVYEEDFTDGLTGWNVINTVGTESWEAADFGGAFYARASAFQGSGNPAANMVSWLISPSFDFDAQTDEQLVLEIADAFSDAGEEPLSVFYSTDYISGNNPSTATWIEIGADEIAALPINTGFFDNEYDQTGLIDLSSVVGDGVIAFVYDSDNGAISSTRDISNVKILTPQ
ncbi:DUF5689 domain-containing protein [Winogradskyella luteola]|uniref:Choice-of-anchor J domain-containing protein n=1 Tax=Winogradskyella luteola TaxID=2828330 RepID=A0A9X1F962_9FLAO|nr:DUF5689 domain-containing protein [Winogradskyella luteola]MBV7269637.1 choice-of-anchor J domain-containing protein [Winogradskyella luteola]